MCSQFLCKIRVYRDPIFNLLAINNNVDFALATIQDNLLIRNNAYL